MFTSEDIDRMLEAGGDVVTNGGDKIGSIADIYVDAENDEPAWVTVRTGLFGASLSFVPLQGARIDGNDILVPYMKDEVKDAPRVAEDGTLDLDEEDRLYNHYGIGITYTEAKLETDETAFVAEDETIGTSAAEMTGAEESLAGAGEQEEGRARLRKYITSGNPGPHYPGTAGGNPA
jgi:hypothetical protein